MDWWDGVVVRFWFILWILAGLMLFKLFGWKGKIMISLRSEIDFDV